MNIKTTAGIDFGNQSCLLSIPTEHGTEIILNESSNRKTPTMVSYLEGRRTSGEFAQQQQMMNINSTITQIKQLVGLIHNLSERKSFSKLVSYKIVNTKSDSIAVELENGQVLSIEQIIGYYLRSLYELIQKKNPNIKQLVLTVPPSWTEIQRRSLLNAASISKIKIAHLLDSSVAASIAYTKTHGDRLGKDHESAKNILFIEFGDTSMNSFIGKLSKNSIEILSNHCDESLGGQKFNEILENYLLQKVYQKYKIDPSKNKRSTIRFKQAVEKTKKTLSSNPIVMFEIPSLMNGIDISIQVKREEFIDLIKEKLNKIGPNIEETIKIAGIKKEDIEFVELIGGGSRIPSIKSKIKEIMKKDVKMSLDLDECFAIGAGFMASQIDGKNIGIQIINDKKLKHKITAKIENETKSFVLFNESTKIPTTKKISIPIKQKQKLHFYSDQIPIGIATIETGIDKQNNVEIEIKINSFGLIDIKNTKNVSYSHLFALNSNEILNYQKIEEEQRIHDKLEIEIDNIKNDLESLIFSTENELKSIEFENKNQIKKEIDKIHNWFNINEFERLTLDEYKSKINEIIELKKYFYTNTKQEETKKNQIQSIKQKLQKILDEIEKDTEKIQTNESIHLQKEISNKIKIIDELLKSSNQNLNSFDTNELNKEVEEIQTKLKSLNEVSIKKNKKIKKRRIRNHKNQPQQIFRNRLSDTWSSFGMRNNFFGNFMENPWITNHNQNNEFEYSYEYEQDNEDESNNQQKNKEESMKKEQEKQKQIQIQVEKENELKLQKQKEKQEKIDLEQKKKTQLEFEKQRKIQIEKENELIKEKQAKIEFEKKKKAHLDFEKQRKIQVEKENQRRKQKEAEFEEIQRRAKIEQERREKEAEMYQRERFMNDPWRQNRWGQSTFGPWGTNPQRQSVKPSQYQHQQRRMMPGYGYPFGF